MDRKYKFHTPLDDDDDDDDLPLLFFDLLSFAPSSTSHLSMAAAFATATSIRIPVHSASTFHSRTCSSRRARSSVRGNMAGGPPASIKPLLFAKAGADGRSLGDCPFTQKANLALRFGAVDFDVHCIDTSDKPEWFIRLTRAATTPALRTETRVLEDSDAIVAYADTTGSLRPALTRVVPGWEETKSVTDALFSPFVALMRNKEETKEKPLRAALGKVLERLNGVLAQSGGAFVLGDHVSALDCNVAPQLYHIIVAGKHYKTYDLLPEYVLVEQYMARMQQTPQWKATVCAPETIIWGWSKFFT